MTSSTRAKPRPAIDPRIRDRRIEVKRHEGRRRLRLLMVLLGVVLVTSALGAATRSPLLDVDRVLVTGAQNTPVRAVLRAAGLSRHRLMIDVHADRIARGVDRLPWVDKVVVERTWPSTVRITILERVAVAALPATGGGWALADARGRVLAHRSTPPADVLQVAGGPSVGADGTTVARPLAPALKVAAAIPEALRTRAPIVLVAADGIELKLVPNGIARLGSVDQLAAKLDSVLTVLDHANVANLVVLDVRVPGAPVLTRR